MVKENLQFESLADYEKLYRYKAYQESFFKHSETISVAKNLIKWILLRSGLLYSRPQVKECEILILHESGRVIELRKGFSEELERRGFNIQHDLVQTGREIARKRWFSKPGYHLPAEFSIEAGYAEYIIEKYKPKILLTFLDNSVLSVFLRKKMKSYGNVINIAHGVTSDNHLFSMFDFDYVFIFGKSSLKNIKRNPVRFGNTKAVLTGSIFINKDFTLLPNKERTNILFFSSWIPEQVREVVLRNFEVFREYAAQHQEYKFFIKLHPLEDRSVWEKRAEGVANIDILDQRVDFKEALRSVSLVLHQWSNASIEAALLNRPSISINTGNVSDDYLCCEEFFLPRATDVRSLHERISTVFNDYDYYVGKCEEYASYHLENRYAIDYVCDCIESIYKGREDFPVHYITETLEGLK